MHAKRSKQLVVDASIVRAAGGEKAVHQLSKACRDLLKQILDVCHRVVVTPEIQIEWKKHRSIYASQWQTIMYSRKKIVTLSPKQYEPIRDWIDSHADEKLAQVMLKDCLLLDAAIAADYRIFALDDTVRGHFHIASEEVGDLKNIHWINPRVDIEIILEWLASGAENNRGYCLGHQPQQA